MSNKGILYTRIVVLAVVALLIIYDIAIFAISGVDATISRVVLGWARDLTIIVLGVGILMGHLFWPQFIEKDKEKKDG